MKKMLSALLVSVFILFQGANVFAGDVRIDPTSVTKLKAVHHDEEKGVKVKVDHRSKITEVSKVNK